MRFYRQRSRIVGALATPILFWSTEVVEGLSEHCGVRGGLCWHALEGVQH